MKKYIVIDSSDAQPCGRPRWEIYEEDTNDPGWFEWVEDFDFDDKDMAYDRCEALNDLEAENGDS